MDIFPPSMISLLPQRILFCSVFFLWKSIHTCYFSPQRFFQLCCISFKNKGPNLSSALKMHTNQERLQWHADCTLCSIPLIIISGLHLLFWQHKALYSDWQQSAHSPLQHVRNQDCTLTCIPSGTFRLNFIYTFCFTIALFTYQPDAHFIIVLF